MTELLAYLAPEKAKGSETVVEDIQDLKEAGRLVLDGIDGLLRLAPRDNVPMLEQNTKDQAVTAARRPTSAGRQLEGAVSGERASLRAHGYRKYNYVQVLIIARMASHSPGLAAHPPNTPGRVNDLSLSSSRSKKSNP